MKLKHEFYKLPLSFDVEKLQQEILQFKDSDWSPHHENFKGNYAVPLISVNGEKNNDFKGPMKACQALKDSPYIKQVLASFNEVFGRSRLMALDPGCEVPLHSDINYHWYKRVRIHIPIISSEEVIFHCGDKQVHMAPGECWIFDSWKNHKVVNNSKLRRIHLVIDTFGSSRFWQMIEQSEVPGVKAMLTPIKHLDFNNINQQEILTESYNVPLVMAPGELDSLINDLRLEVEHNETNSADTISAFCGVISRFAQDWRRLWSLYGQTEQGWSHYHRLRDSAFQVARNFDNKLLISNGGSALKMLIHCIIDPALNPEVVEQSMVTKANTKSHELTTKKAPSSATPPAAGISRNSPCTCGSGKKYKQCCGVL